MALGNVNEEAKDIDRSEILTNNVNDNPNVNDDLKDITVDEDPQKSDELKDENVIDESLINKNDKLDDIEVDEDPQKSDKLNIPNLYHTIPDKTELGDINVN